MSIDISKKLVNQRKNQYINKTFEDFRNELVKLYEKSFLDFLFRYVAKVRLDKTIIAPIIW